MPIATKPPYPAQTPKLSGGYPSLRDIPPSKPRVAFHQRLVPHVPELTYYPPLTGMHAPGRSGALSEPVKGALKPPKYRIGQRITFASQGGVWQGKITSWARDEHANNWYGFAPDQQAAGDASSIWIPEAAVNTKMMKAMKRLEGYATTIMHKGVKVKGVITAVDSRFGRPVFRVKVATATKDRGVVEGEVVAPDGDSLRVAVSNALRNSVADGSVEVRPAGEGRWQVDATFTAQPQYNRRVIEYQLKIAMNRAKASEWNLGVEVDGQLVATTTS